MPSKVRTKVPETFAELRRLLAEACSEQETISVSKAWEIFRYMETVIEKAVEKVKLEMRNYRLKELSESRKEARKYKRLYETAELLHEAEKAELKEKALRDDDTGLYRKKHFLTAVLPGFVEKVAKDRRAHHDRRGGAALWYVDLNKLKLVNDDERLGHLMGDELIAWIAELLNNHIRQSESMSSRMYDPLEDGTHPDVVTDVVAKGQTGRVGGDEFLVLQPTVQRQVEVWVLASRIKQRYDLRKWHELEPYLAARYMPSVAIGIALLHVSSIQGETEHVQQISEAWIKKAESAMYVNKNSGLTQITMIGVEWDREKKEMVEFDINKEGEWVKQIQTVETR